jgi:Cu-processing system ATP-binding protein
MIAFDRFSKSFGLRNAVDALSLSIARGETVALLGPNGSGKTTCLKAAAGLLAPTSGTVLLGEPGDAALKPSARRIVSFLPQRVAFPDALTGTEVVDFYRRLRGIPDARTHAVLRVASLNGAAERPVSTYSGGMLQRLGLAVAMLPDADVLLLDEPTAALDPEGLAAFYALVERRRRDGGTVLFTSHQVGDVERLADRFLVLVRGRLVAELTQAALRDRLSARGFMRLRLSRRPTALLDAVRRLAPAAEWADDELVVPGPAALRPAVLDFVRRFGADVLGLVAQDGQLDALYRELVAAAPAEEGVWQP